MAPLNAANEKQNVTPNAVLSTICSKVMRRVLRAQMAGVPRANAAGEIHGAPGTRGTIVDVMTRVSADLVCSVLKRLRGYGAPRSSQLGTIHVAKIIASTCNEIRLCSAMFELSFFIFPPTC